MDFAHNSHESSSQVKEKSHLSSAAVSLLLLLEIPDMAQSGCRIQLQIELVGHEAARLPDLLQIAPAKITDIADQPAVAPMVPT